MAVIAIGLGCAWSVNGLARRWHVVAFCWAFSKIDCIIVVVGWIVEEGLFKFGV